MVVDACHPLALVEVREQPVPLLIGNAQHRECRVAKPREVLSVDHDVMVNAREHAVDQVGVRQPVEHAEEVVEVADGQLALLGEFVAGAYRGFQLLPVVLVTDLLLGKHLEKADALEDALKQVAFGRVLSRHQTVHPALHRILYH